MRKLLLFISTIAFFILPGFDQTEQISISSIDTTIIKAENILRYDIKIKNEGPKPFKSEFDYPGQYHYGLEVVVRPGEKLASKMEMVEDSKYMKMLPMGSGGTGMIDSGKEGSFHVEYRIKDGGDPKEVKKWAFDSTVLIIDGVKIIKEFPLNHEG